MFFSDCGLNVRMCVLSAVFILCSSCSVTSSSQSVQVRQGSDSGITETLSQKIKVRVINGKGEVTDEFTGDRTITVNALGGQTYQIELKAADEMAEKCIFINGYGKTIKPVAVIDSEKLPGASWIKEQLSLEHLLWMWDQYSFASLITTTTDEVVSTALTPTDTTVNILWNYNDYPDIVTYYPDIRNTDECVKWLKDSGYSDEEIHKVFDKPYYLKTPDTEKDQHSREDVEGGPAANGYDCTLVSTECER